MKFFLTLALSAVVLCSWSFPTAALVHPDEVPTILTKGDLTDIHPHWAKESILQAVEEGWVVGYPDHSFRPNAKVSRAEFIKMVALANGIHPTANAMRIFPEFGTPGAFRGPAPAVFRGIEPHWVWSQGWLGSAIAWGLVVPSDYASRSRGPSVKYPPLAPDEPINRREAAVITVRAMGEVVTASQTSAALPFTDEKQIPAWVKGYINVAADSGVIKGYPDGRFAEYGLLTRAEAVTMIIRQKAYNNRGIDLSLRLEVGKGGQVSQVQPVVPLQVIDDTIYAPLRSVFHDETNWQWQPVQQTISFDYGVQFSYQLGSDDFQFYGYKAGDLPQPVRVLHGEVMIPVYSLKTGKPDPGVFHFDATWDAARKTIIVKPLFVDPPIS